MLFQLLLDFIFFLLKIVLRIVGSLLAVPFGIYWFFLEFCPDFTNEAGFWFWSVFTIVTIIAYYILWKPIIWIAGLSSIFEIGMD